MAANQPNDDAVSAFIAKKVEIDALLKEIMEASEDHFGVNPDRLNWGHVGDLQRSIDLLRQARSWAVR